VSEGGRSENATTESAAPATGAVEPTPEYDLEAVAAGSAVPRIFDQFPPSGHALRREESWRRLLPLVLLVNEEILGDRKQLWTIRQERARGEPLAPEERIWLELVSERYAVPGSDLRELARRVDAIPPSIMLAAVATLQSEAQVGGRGAKSAAAERAALIRQVFGEKPPPLDSPLNAVRAYARALNTMPANGNFRTERERLRHLGQPLDGAHLAAFLPKLQPGNSLGADQLTTMITTQRLTRFDRAQLQPTDPAN
jgi:Bax protein